MISVEQILRVVVRCVSPSEFDDFVRVFRAPNEETRMAESCLFLAKCFVSGSGDRPRDRTAAYLLYTKAYDHGTSQRAALAPVLATMSTESLYPVR